MSRSAPTETAVTVFEAPSALAVLTDAKAFDRFYDQMKAETDRLAVDLTTETGRKAIASMAYKVARTKTAIDEAGKTLTAEWRDKIGLVDQARKAIRDRLDVLKEEVRRPLTDWEAAEEAREELARRIVGNLRSAGVVMASETAHEIADRLDEIKLIELSPDTLQGHFEIARNLRAQAIGALTEAHIRLLREEDDRAELDRLRAAEAVRLAVEAERVAEQERLAEAEREAAELAERQHQAELTRQAEIDAAAKRAEDAAKAEAERQRAEQERAHAEALAAEKRRADEAEAARLRDQRAAEAKAATEAAVADKLIAEAKAREEDRRHRSEVMRGVKETLMRCGADEDTAKKIVLATIAKEISHVVLEW